MRKNILKISMLLIGVLTFGLAKAQLTINIGTGTSTTTGTGQSPFGTFYHDDRTQMLYTASEISAAGGVPGNITSVGFNVSSAQPQIMNNFNIKIWHTTATSLNTISGPSPTGTTVYTGSHTAVSGWNDFVLQTPFLWNGTDNIIVEVCFDNTSYTSNSGVYYTTTSANTVASRYADGSTGCTHTGGYTYDQRPNIRFDLIALEDAGISQIISPSVPNCLNDEVYISLANEGGDTLTNATIHWSVDGVTQNPVLWTGQVPPFGGVSDSVLVGFAVMNMGDELKIWTSDPNGSNDIFPENDTAVYTVPTYVEHNLPPTAILCEGEMDTLDTEVYFGDHMWNNGSTQRYLAISTAGQYSVTIEDVATGCIQEEQVNVVEESPVSLPDTVVKGCEVDGGVSLTGNVPGDYQWSTGANTSFLNVTESGTYYVSVTDPTGKCTSIDSVDVNIYSDPVSGFIGDRAFLTLILTDTSLNAQNYFWDFGDGLTSTQQNPTHIYANEGEFDVMLAVSNFCGADTTYQTFNIIPTSISENGVSEKDFLVYPNPTSNQLNITSSNISGNVNIELIDITGKVILNQKTNISSGQKVMYNVSDLSPGVYSLKLTQDQKSSTFRVIVN